MPVNIKEQIRTLLGLNLYDQLKTIEKPAYYDEVMKYGIVNGEHVIANPSNTDGLIIPESSSSASKKEIARLYLIDFHKNLEALLRSTSGGAWPDAQVNQYMAMIKDTNNNILNNLSYLNLPSDSSTNLNYPNHIFFNYKGRLIGIPKAISLKNLELSSESSFDVTFKTINKQTGNTKDSTVFLKQIVKTIFPQTFNISKVLTDIFNYEAELKRIRTSINLNYNAFNFFIALLNHYEKYQTTGLLFEPKGSPISKAILSGNILKALESQASLLSPNGFDKDYNNLNFPFRSIATSAGIPDEMQKFIRLFTMGYLKPGDIITSGMSKFFAVNETYTQIYERIKAVSTLGSTGALITPSYFTNYMGTDWAVNTLPTGRMILNMIQSVLVEADEFYRLINPAGQLK